MMRLTGLAWLFSNSRSSRYLEIDIFRQTLIVAFRMKHFGSFTPILSACLVVLLMNFLAVDLQAENAKPLQAIVRAVRGTAKYTTGKGVWVPVKVGTKLKAGDTIQTGPESTVDLFLGQSVVRVNADTAMGFDKLTQMGTGVETVTETQLNLQSGRILGNVKKLAAASKYEIKTPHGVAGIRGTEFIIDAGGRGRIVVIAGTVLFAPAGGGQVVTIFEGNQYLPPADPNVAINQQNSVSQAQAAERLALAAAVIAATTIANPGELQSTIIEQATAAANVAASESAAAAPATASAGDKAAAAANAAQAASALIVQAALDAAVAAQAFAPPATQGDANAAISLISSASGRLAVQAVATGVAVGNIASGIGASPELAATAVAGAIATAGSAAGLNNIATGLITGTAVQSALGAAGASPTTIPQAVANITSSTMTTVLNASPGDAAFASTAASGIAAGLPPATVAQNATAAGAAAGGTSADATITLNTVTAITTSVTSTPPVTTPVTVTQVPDQTFVTPTAGTTTTTTTTTQ
jgi:hypothetical protein